MEPKGGKLGNGTLFIKQKTGPRQGRWEGTLCYPLPSRTTESQQIRSCMPAGLTLNDGLTSGHTSPAPLRLGQKGLKFKFWHNGIVQVPLFQTQRVYTKT